MKVADALRPRPVDAGPNSEGVRPSWGARWPWAGPVVVAAMVLVVAAGVVLRFWTTSPLWLDETLTVNISHLPLGQIPAALKQDGSPPLFYLLLHFWMEAFGTGDLAVRSLSGAFGVGTLPLAWVAGRRLGGRSVALAAMFLLASSPFAVRYSTETRMYMMIVFLTLIGILLLDDALRRPTKPRLAGVALTSGLLLVSHYWTLFLIASVLLMLAWMARRAPDPARRRAAGWCIVAVASGFVLLAPWLGILYFQLRHTGTPWAQPASFSAVVNAVSSFAGGGTNEGRALGLLFFALAGLGLFGVAVDRRHIDLDLRTRPAGRAVAWVSGITLVIAIAAGLVLRSAFNARYASVIFAAFLLLAALGTATFADLRVRSGVVAAAVAFGFLGSVANIHTDRTQAAQVAAAIQRLGAPGDLVVYCPDQLGPAVSRILPGGVYDQITYPRALPPQRVDWVDYAKVNRASNYRAFARMALQRAGSHAIWLVWSPDYRTLSAKCTGLERTIAAARPDGRAVINQDPARFYEHENLDVFRPS